MADNIVLGRGKVYFDRFAQNTDVSLGGERFLGNCPSFGLSVETQELEHYRSTEGLREKDLSVTLQIDVSGTVTTDNIDLDNIAAFFFGEKQVTTQGALTGQTDTFVANKGRFYQLGTSLTNPGGLKNVAAVVVTKDPAGTPVVLVENTDYTVDAALGRVQLLESGVTLANGDTIEIDYNVGAHTHDLVVSGTDLIYGSMRFLAFNGVGKQTDFFMPKVALRPNGEYNLLGEDWQQFSFNLEVLKLGDLRNIYADGRPYNLV